MRFEVLVEVKMSVLVIYVVTCLNLWLVTNVSEEHTVFIFRSEDEMYVGIQHVCWQSRRYKGAGPGAKESVVVSPC
jgi:hypothetical protein